MQYVLYIIGGLFLFDGIASGHQSWRGVFMLTLKIIVGLTIFGGGLFLRYRGLN